MVITEDKYQNELSILGTVGRLFCLVVVVF